MTWSCFNHSSVCSLGWNYPRATSELSWESVFHLKNASSILFHHSWDKGMNVLTYPAKGESPLYYSKLKDLWIIRWINIVVDSFAMCTRSLTREGAIKLGEELIQTDQFLWPVNWKNLFKSGWPRQILDPRGSILIALARTYSNKYLYNFP